MVRVALVGDSQLTDTSSRDVIKLGPRLRRRRHEVETLAVEGMKTRDAVAIAADVGNAEWTVYCFGANDAAPWKRVPPEEFAANYEMLLRRGAAVDSSCSGPHLWSSQVCQGLARTASWRCTRPSPPTWPAAVVRCRLPARRARPSRARR